MGVYIKRQKLANVLITLLISGIMVPLIMAANGYGTSSITLSKYSINLTAGGSADVNYTVNLASGNTWGTNLVVANQNQLANQGITVSTSNPSGDPPFSGHLTVHVGTTQVGTYQLVLAATGDDPSISNTTLTIIVSNPGATTTISSGTTATTTISYALSYSFSNAYLLLAEVVIILIAMAIAMTVKKAPSSRLILLGVALILIGTLLWLYADYSGGNFTYIWTGVALIIVGTIVWLYGDHKGHLI